MKSSIQLDIKRIQTLTDSVFAVAMTILVLGIKVPLQYSSGRLSEYVFHDIIPELCFYLLSFMVLGIFWVGSHFHHHVIRTTDRISSWLNILFLMMVCIIPFSAEFINHYPNERISIIFYSINLIMTSLCNLLMLIYAWKKQYVRPVLTYETYKKTKRRILIPIGVYFLIIPVSFISAKVSEFFFLIPIILHFIPERNNKLVEY